MVSRIEVEWQESPIMWRTGKAEIWITKTGNTAFKFRGKLYVMKDQREGTPVLQKITHSEDVEKTGWTVAGRITRGRVFLGEGISYYEYCQTPEGRQAVLELLQSLRKR